VQQPLSSWRADVSRQARAQQFIATLVHVCPQQHSHTDRDAVSCSVAAKKQILSTEDNRLRQMTNDFVSVRMVTLFPQSPAVWFIPRQNYAE
jgi:hypothetical protein